MSKLYHATKAAAGVSGLELDAAELAQIHKYTLREYTPDELFAFKVTACDNEIDRDREAFTIPALEQLAALYVGKTVLNDKHVLLPENQCARVYAAAVVKERGKKTRYGAPYARLEVRAYIPRTDHFSGLIQLVESGIHKEVSVGCAVAKKTCSICGNPFWSLECDHQLGMEYEDGATCFIKLEDAKDAYEISFVAVPAQPAAGVTKSANGTETSPGLAELQDVMQAVKHIAARLDPPEPGSTPPPAAPMEQEVEQLVQSAKALYTPYL